MHYRQKCELTYESKREVEIAMRKAQKAVDIECDYYKDRSRFAELPRVGDKVYELCRINQFGDYKIVESEIKGFIVDTDGTAFDYELLGKRFFLTPEEALKERDFNGQSQN